MADHDPLIKQTSPSKTSARPSVSAPSSMGGTSAPRIVFDYCPTSFGEERPAAPEPSQPSPPATDGAPPDSVEPEHAPSHPSQASPVVAEAGADEPATDTDSPHDPTENAGAPMDAGAPMTPDSPCEPTKDAARPLAATFSLPLLDIAQAGVNANLGVILQLAAARALAEVLQLQTALLHQQFAAVTAQTEEIVEFTRKFIAPPALSAPSSKAG